MPDFQSLLNMDDQTRFDLKLDTERSLDRTFSNLGDPTLPGTGLEKYLTSTQAVKGPNDTLSIPFTDALFSNNKSISDTASAYIAKNNHESEMRDKYKTDYSILSTPQQAEKYVDKKFGYNPLINNDDFYYKNDYMTDGLLTRSAKNVGVFVGRVLGSAVMKLGEGLATTAGAIAAGTESLLGGNNDVWADIADNHVAKYLENAEQDFKDRNTWAVYHSIDYDKKGIFAKAADATFWTDSFADGAAFMVSAFAPGMALSKLGLLSEASSFFGTTTKAAQFGNKALEIASLGSKNWGELGMWAYNTASESLLEAKQTYTDSRTELQALRGSGDKKYKDISDAEISKISGEKASNVFNANLAILSLSNAWENRIIFGMAGKTGASASKAFEKEFGSKIGAIAEDFTVKSTSKELKGAKKFFDFSEDSRLGFYGEHAVGGIIAEGLWEENAQLAVQRMQASNDLYVGTDPKKSKLYYTGKNDSFYNTLVNFGKQLTGQAFAGDSDPEAAESIFLGALLGGGAGTMIGKITGGANADGSMKLFKGERQQRIEATEAKIAAVNVASANYKDLLSGLYNPDGSLNEGIFALRQAKLEKEVNKQLSVESLKDPNERDFVQKTIFTNYLLATLKAGKFDQVIGRLKELVDKSDKEITDLGYDPSLVKNKNIDIIQFAEEGKERWDKIDKSNMDRSVYKDYNVNEANVMDQDRKLLAFTFTMKALAAKELTAKNEVTLTTAKQEMYDILVNKAPIAENHSALLAEKLIELNSIPGHIANLENLVTQGAKSKTMPKYEIEAREKEITQAKEAYSKKEADLKELVTGINTEGTKIDLEKSGEVYSVKNNDTAAAILNLTAQATQILGQQSIGSYADFHYAAMMDSKEGLNNYKQYIGLTEDYIKEALNKYTPSKEHTLILTNLGYTPENIKNFTKTAVENIVKNQITAKKIPLKVSKIVNPIPEKNSPGDLSRKQSPSFFSEIWFESNKKEQVKNLTETFTTKILNEALSFEVIENTASQEKTVNFKSGAYTIVFAPPATIIVLKSGDIVVGRIQNPNIFEFYKKVGDEDIRITNEKMTLEDFKAFFSTLGSETDAQIAEDMRKYLQDSANMNYINNELSKPEADIQKIAKVIVSLGNLNYAGGESNTIEDLKNVLPANCKILGAINKELNQKIVIEAGEDLSESDVEELKRLQKALNAADENSFKSQLAQKGRYSVAVRLPNGIVFIELSQMTFDESKLQNVLTQLQEKSADTVANNLNAEGKSIINSYNNPFQTEVLNKIFIAIGQESLLKQGIEVKLVLGPTGSLRIDLAKNNAKGELKSLTFGKSENKLDIFISAEEIAALKTPQELIEKINEKLKGANNSIAKQIKLSNTSFKVAINKLFSYEVAKSLKTPLGKTPFLNPNLRLKSLTDVKFATVNTNLPRLTPAELIIKYKGKEFNVKRSDGSIIKGTITDVSKTYSLTVTYSDATKGIFKDKDTLAALVTKEDVKAAPIKEKAVIKPAAPVKAVEKIDTSLMTDQQLFELAMKNAKEAKETGTITEVKPIETIITPTANVLNVETLVEDTSEPDVSATPFIITAEMAAKFNPVENDDSSPFKIVQSSYTQEDESDNKLFLEFMQKTLPSNIFSVKQVQKIGETLKNGNIKVGRFVTTLRSVSEGAKGTIETVGSKFQYHEAFHGIYRLLLSTKEQATIQETALENIYKELKKENKTFFKALEDFKNENFEKYSTLSEKDLKALYVEEWVADKFEDYKNSQTIKPVIATTTIEKFFQKLLQLIKSFFGKGTSLFMPENELNKFFKEVDRGVYKNRVIAENPFTTKLYEEGFGEVEANKIKVLKTVVSSVNEKGETVQKPIFDYLSDSDTSMAIASVFNSFIDLVHTERSYNTNQLLERILDDFKESVTGDYDSANNKILKDRLLPLMALFNNAGSRESLKLEVNKLLEYIGYTQGLTAEDLEEFEDDFGDRKSAESYSDSENFGGFKSLSKEIREYLATISSPDALPGGRVQTNQGRPIFKQIFIPFVYNGILKATAGTTTDIEFLEKLRQFSKYNENTLIFTRQFFKDIYNTEDIIDTNNLDEYDLSDASKIKNTTLFQLFRKNFETMAMTYKIVGLDITKKQIQIINANTKNSAKLQFQKWTNGFIDKRNRVNDEDSFVIDSNIAFGKLLTALNKTDYTSQEIFKDSEALSAEILKKTGMNFHPLMIRLSLLDKLSEENKTEEDKTLKALYNNVQSMSVEDVGYISKTISKGENPFLSFFEELKDDKDETVNLTQTGAKSRLLNLAVENAKLDEFVWDSVFINAENKKVWTHQNHNYNSVIFKELQKGNYVPTNSQLYEDEKFQTVLPFIELFRQGGLKTIVLTKDGEDSSINENLQTNKKAGVTYGGLDTRSFYISLFASYFDSRSIKGVTVTPHLTRILESSNTGDMAELPVRKAMEGDKLSEEAETILINEFKKEVDNITKTYTDILSGKDYVKVKSYNDGNIDAARMDKERPRGTRFFAFNELLGPVLAAKFEERIREHVETKSTNILFGEQEMGEVKTRLNNYFFNPEKGLIRGIFNDLISEGLITYSDTEDKVDNRFLPGEFFGIKNASTETKLKDLHLKTGENSFIPNLSQFVINDFLNTFMYNNMIFKNQSEFFKDPVDMIKRAKGINAGGFSIYSELVNPELGIHHPTTKMDVIIKPTDEYFSELKGESQDRADAQSFITEKMFRHIMFALGRLDTETAAIYDKIMNGTEDVDDVFGKTGSISFNRQQNVLKLVYFDGITGNYIKTSSVVLTKKLGSYQDENGEWLALPNRKKIHQLRTEMEELEKNNSEDLADGKLVWVATSSASKMRTVLAKNGEFEDLLNNKEFIQKDVPTKFLRLQTENPSNKSTGIIDPTQFKNIIDTEQYDGFEIPGKTYIDDKGKTVPLTIKEVRRQYQENSKQRLGINYLSGRNSIFNFITPEQTIQSILHELDLNISLKQVSPKLDKFRKMAVETLKSSGSSSSTIEFFEGDFELNSPFIREKFEDLISSFFTNHGFKEKIPGNSFTLATDVGMKVVKQAKVREVNGKRIVEWEVIPTHVVAQNIQGLEGIEEYSTPKLKDKLLPREARQKFLDELVDGQYFIDELQHNVPVYAENGEITEHYTEVIIPPHHKEVETLIRLGLPIDDKMKKLFGVRIPSQDKHSAMTMKVVDFAPAHLGSTLWGAKELIEISGADFDVDKVYAQLMDVYFTTRKHDYIDKNGDQTTVNIPVIHAYGDAQTIEEKFKEYKSWNFTKNKRIKGAIALLEKADPRISAIYKEKDAIYRERDIVTEDFQKKITQTWEKHIAEKLIPNEQKEVIDLESVRESNINLEKRLLVETNFKLITKIKYAIAENIVLLQEAKNLSRNDEDVSPLIQHKQAISDRIQYTEEVNDKINSLNKELLKIKSTIKETVAKENNLATSAEELFQLTKKFGEQNIGVLNNLLLDNKFLLQSNDHVVKNKLDVAPADLSIFQNWQKSDNFFSQFLRKDVSLFPDTLLGKIKHQKSNKEGAANIGPAVNTMLIYSLYHKYNVQLKKGEEININGKDYFKYDQTETDHNARGDKRTRIFNMISQVVTAMTDNAKERIAFKHNLTIDSIPVFVHMIALGIDEDIAQGLLLHPAVFEYYNEIRENKLSVKDLATLKSKKMIREGLLDSYKVDPTLEFDYTTESIIDSLKNPTSESEHHALKLLFKLEDQTSSFSDILNIIKLPKGLYGGMSTFRTVRESLENLELEKPLNAKSFFEEEKSFPWVNLDNALKQHYTGQMVNQVKELSRLNKTISIPITSVFNKLIHSVYQQVSVKNYNKENFYKNLINDYLSFLSAKIYLKSKQGSKIGEVLNPGILVGPQSLGTLIEKSKSIYTNVYGNKSSLLNEYLTVIPANVTQVVNGQEITLENPRNKSGFDIVRSNTFTAIDENEMLMLQNEYENMISSGNPILIQTAMSIYAYAIVKDGHMFKSGGLLQLLPPRVLKEFMNTLKIVKTVFIDGEDSTDIKQLNKSSKSLFEEHFGTNFLAMTREFTKIYMESQNNRDNIVKVIGMNNESRTITRNTDGFTVDLFKGVKNRDLSEKDEKDLLSMGINPSQLPKSFFEGEFGKRIQELKDKGFKLYMEEENGKKRWKIAFPLVVKTTYSGSPSNFYRLKNISSKQSTQFENFYSEDFNILSDIAEYEKFDLVGGYSLSTISGMFGELPSSIKKKNLVNALQNVDETDDSPDAQLMRAALAKKNVKVVTKAPVVATLKVEKFEGIWTRAKVAQETGKVFLFGDNTDDRINTHHVPTSTQAVIRDLPNAIGIDTKKDRGSNKTSYFTDAYFDIFKTQVDQAIQKAKASGKIIVIPADGIGTGKAELKERAPKLFEYLENQLNALQQSPAKIETVAASIVTPTVTPIVTTTIEQSQNIYDGVEDSIIAAFEKAMADQKAGIVNEQKIIPFSMEGLVDIVTKPENECG